ncbi:MAG: RAD55 family ATPase [Melioribacteraceae bacterium]|nr:RAD55 family ATPase [Melioribacteraceae bacterium]
MNSGINIIRSGFSLIDEKWGGVYQGGSYMIVGPRKSGRTLLSLQLALETAKDNETCLYFTTMRPRDLMIHASSLNFDLQKYMNRNRIIVVRVNPPTDIYDMYNPDDFLIEYMNDIITVASQYKPSRIIFDELTPFIGFRSLDILEDVFAHLLETVEEKNITSFFVVGEPATQKTEDIINILRDNATGTISIHKLNEKIHGKYHGGIVSIIPNVGHTEGEFQSEFWIEPKVGILVVPSEEPEMVMADETNGFNKQTKNGVSHKSAKQDGFKINMEDRNLDLSNLYPYNDFQLILNNQIALYQSTGQKFHFISFKLDQTAHIQGLLSVNQLQNAIGLSINKRDKFCIIDNHVVLLLIRSSYESKKKIFNSVKKHLPSSDPKYIEAISKFIFGVEIEIDDSITNAESLLTPITSNDSRLEYISFNEFIEK